MTPLRVPNVDPVEPMMPREDRGSFLAIFGLLILPFVVVLSVWWLA